MNNTLNELTQAEIQEIMWTDYAAGIGFSLARGDPNQGGYWLARLADLNNMARWLPNLLAVQQALTGTGDVLIEYDPCEIDPNGAIKGWMTR